MTCPDKNQDKEFQKLISLLNGDEGAAYRMWRNHENMHPNEGSIYALRTFESSPTEKIQKLKDAVKGLTLDKDTHVYYWDGDKETSIMSLSRALDQVEEITTRRIKSLPIYAESGTVIHDLFHQIVITTNPKTNPAVLDKMKQHNIPDNLLEELINLKDELSKMGTLMSEQLVYTGGTPESQPIAGTADIIIYAPDGRKYIVDLKTSYVTPANPMRGNTWKPFDHGAQKAKRYTSQVHAYGRMTEWADGQPVTDHFIVPIEVELADNTDVTKGYTYAKVLPKENVKDWKYVDFAIRTLDAIFKQSSKPSSTTGIKGKDDSSQVYEALTGDHSSGDLSAEEIARNVRKTTRGYYDKSGKFWPFTSTDPKAQLQQIIDEYVNRTMRINSDLSYGVKSFLQSGDTRYLGIDNKSTLDTVSRFLRPFVGRNDIEVFNLSDIKGFEKKKNWLLIEEGKVRHLMYLGSENLDEKFRTEKGFVNNSLFGKFIDKKHSDHTLNSSLKNTLGDARKFEGSLIALKLKQANPDITFGLTSVMGLGKGSVFGEIIDLKENLETIKNIRDDIAVRDKILTPDILEILSDDSYLDYSNYRADYQKLLADYIRVRKEVEGDVSQSLDKLVSSLSDYSTNETVRQEMIEKVGEYLNEHINLGKSVSVDYETLLLSQFYLQMQDMDVSLIPSNRFNAWESLPMNISNPLLAQLNAKLNTAANNMSTAFRFYKDKTDKALNAYLKSKGIADAAIDIFTGNTPRHYEELFKKQTRKVSNEDGTTQDVTVSVFEFVEEGSAEFNALSKEAQNLITLYNDIIGEIASENRIPWKRGRLPLVQGTIGNRIMNAKRTGAGEYGKIVSDMLVDLEDNFGVGDRSKPRVGNIFYYQKSDDFNDRHPVMMGLQSDGFINLDEYHKWTTNLEIMGDVFIIQGLKNKVFNEIGGSMRAVNSIFNYYKSNLMDERLGTNIDWVNNMSRINLDLMDIDSGSPANRAARVVNRLSSIGLYAFNPITAMTAFLGNELTMFSEAIGNSVSNSGRFGVGSVLKAKGIMTSIFGRRVFDPNALEKTSLLMRKFRLFNEDISSMLNGYHREGDKFLFRSKYMFSLLNGADYATRMNIMIAQMIEEGSWDAYTVVDGNLTYDETKDERFNGRGKLSKEEAKALREVIARNNGQDPIVPLESGHDDNMSNSIRGISNYLLGTNDREGRAMLNFVWWGKVFGASKNWFAAKLDRWILGLGNRVNKSAMIGSYKFETDQNGNTYAFWDGDQMEGIIVSWLAMIDNLRKSADQRKPLTAVQKNNITRSVGDLVLVLAATMLAMSIKDDDSDTTTDDILSMVIRRATDDLLTVYTLVTNPDFLWTPIQLEYIMTLMQKSFRSVVKGDPEQMLKNVPIANQIERWYEVMADQDFELVEK